MRALGDIGPLKIVKEESIGANLRRIEAVTGTGPIERLRHEESVLAELATVLNVPVGEVVDGAKQAAGRDQGAARRVKGLRQQAARGRAGELAAQAVDGVLVARVDGIDRESLRDLAVAVRDQPGVRGVVLGAPPEGGGAALPAAVAKDSGLDAGALIADAAKLIKGGGGKDPMLAVAGGKDPEGLDAALDAVRAWLAR